MFDRDLDPLIYGEAHNLSFKNVIFADNVKQTPEMDAKDVLAEQEFEAIMKSVDESRQLQRKLRREQKKQMKNQVQHELVPELISEPTVASNEELTLAAKTDRRPHICLLGPQNIEKCIVHEWNHFCPMAVRARLLHRNDSLPNTPTTIRMLVINREGQVMTVNEDWMRYFSRSGTLFSMYVMSIFDQSRILLQIQDLPVDGRVLIYDPESVRCLARMQSWTCGESSFVMHVDHSSFPMACVVERQDEMFHVSNI